MHGVCPATVAAISTMLVETYLVIAAVTREHDCESLVVGMQHDDFASTV